ncbi:hypothetical protein I5U73_12935 [Stenotrophomonas maltophilia]|nr:hypothetical protein [Stenotrophomonas maltophilia]
MSTKVDTYQSKMPFRQAAGKCRTHPRHPTENQLSPLLWRLPLIRRVQGAALPISPGLATVIIPVHTSLPI